jgi:uncharacterized membrane protein YbhN (UPF0104 family)
LSTSQDEAASEAAPAAPKVPGKTGKRLWLLAKICVAALAFTYVLTRQSWSELTAALSHITPGTLAIATLLQFMCLSTATLRWRSLLRAYGAVRLPPVLALMRVYYVGQFYNTYLPGAVAGDVLRGVATRSAFEVGGATTSVAVVFVERIVGLMGLLLAVALAVPLEVGGHVARDFLPYLSLGILGAAALIVGVAQAPRLAHYMPRPIANIMRGLPVLTHYAPFAVACIISLLIQLMLVTCGHVLVSSIYPEARFSDSMLVVPLAAAAAFFPLSVAGAGPRDAVLVTLYGLAGVPKPAAVATALALLFIALVVGASGGILQLYAPLTLEKRD